MTLRYISMMGARMVPRYSPNGSDCTRRYRNIELLHSYLSRTNLFQNCYADRRVRTAKEVVQSATEVASDCINVYASFTDVSMIAQ